MAGFWPEHDAPELAPDATCSEPGCPEPRAVYAGFRRKRCRAHESDLGRERRQRLRDAATSGDYARLYEAQGGRCAICGGETPDLKLDHDWETGTNRGLLCRECNVGLGMLGDDIEGVLRALDYLLPYSIGT